MRTDQKKSPAEAGDWVHWVLSTRYRVLILSFRLPVLQNFERLLQLVVGRILGLLVLIVRSSLSVFVGQSGILLGAVSDYEVRSDGRILNRLAVRSVVLGDRENQRRAVGHVNQLLHRAIAESLVSDNIAAGIFQDGRSDNLRRAGGAAIHQNRQGKLGDVLGGVGVKRLPRILLSLQVSDGAVIEKQVRRGDALGLVAGGGVAQVEHDLFRALLLQVAKLVGNLLRFPLGEGVHFEVGDVLRQHLVGDRRDGDGITRSEERRVGKEGRSRWSPDH